MMMPCRACLLLLCAWGAVSQPSQNQDDIQCQIQTKMATVVVKAFDTEAVLAVPYKTGSETTTTIPTPCLCTFDIDRTLTGKQNDLKDCPGNQVLDGVYDTAYGGGPLTLSGVGQNFSSTFCQHCYVGIVTAGDASGYESAERKRLVEKLKASGNLASTAWTGPSLHQEARTNCQWASIESPLVVGCNDGTKQFAVQKIVEWLAKTQGVKVAPKDVWHFDDRDNNVLPFQGTGFNARQISCGSRDGPLGLCGAVESEIIDGPGIHVCPAWAYTYEIIDEPGFHV